MEKFIKLAYKQALRAFKKGEIPVGAVIVKNGKVVAKSHNTRQLSHLLLGHAEITCILKAEKKIKDWRLDECEMYVTLAPCDMCTMYIKESRLKRVYFLLNQEKHESYLDNVSEIDDFFELKENYKLLLEKFFLNLRKYNKKANKSWYNIL